MPSTTPQPPTAPQPMLQRTPFYDYHVAKDAKLVDFAGWEMPLHYGSIIEEHHRVRTAGGLFDVSHMGRLRFSGRDARLFLDHVCTRQVHGMQEGQARYTLLCNAEGGCLDDGLVYCFSDHEYLLVCNAASRAKLLDHFAAVKDDMVFHMEDETESTAMIAIQGPAVMDLLSTVSREIPNLKRFRFTTKQVLFAKFMVARTGYTGEDGVEVIFPAKWAKQAIDLLLGRSGAEAAGIGPAGLGSRDSLRLEAGMALYGHELTEDRNVMESDLGFAMKLDKSSDDPSIGRFIGQDAVVQCRDAGVSQRLVGLELEGRRAARPDMQVTSNDQPIGRITSGVWSPTLEKSIAMAYVDVACAEEGTDLQVDLGRTAVNGRVVPLPFYKR